MNLRNRIKKYGINRVQFRPNKTDVYINPLRQKKKELKKAEGIKKCG